MPNFLKRTIVISAIVACGIVGLGLTIKLFTDFANSVPVGSDFFILQRNQSFINSSVSQVKQDWFNNPVFSGNGGIQGVWTATTFVGDGSQLTGINVANTNSSFTNVSITVITNNTFYGTNMTIEVPGGFTNLNLTPLSLMMSDANDAESSLANGVGILTNNGAGGMGWATSIAFDDFYVQNAFLTNAFLKLTNDLLSTDGNGQITNVSIGTGLTFTGNTLSATGVSSLTPATNNDTLVSVAISNLISTISGNATNNDQLFGVNATNHDWVIGSNATNNDTVVATGITNGAINNLTNYANTIAANSTNEVTRQINSGTNIVYTTNIVGAANFVFGKAYWTNASSNFTFPALTMTSAAVYESMAVFVTNSGGSTITATINGVSGAPGHVVPAVFYCTNATVTEIDLAHFGVQWTNACVSKN